MDQQQSEDQLFQLGIVMRISEGEDYDAQPVQN